MGTSEQSLSLPASVRTIADLSAFLEASAEALRGRLSSVRFARNEAFAGADDPIEDGDTVALIPPFSGG